MAKMERLSAVKNAAASWSNTIAINDRHGNILSFNSIVEQMCCQS
jgi:hypothetical protein